MLRAAACQVLAATPGLALLTGNRTDPAPTGSGVGTAEQPSPPAGHATPSRPQGLPD
ncbi:hypothetical protein ACFXPN_03715 [Streptomyces griseorubiginosus]|uniref:hypothetical protein n=1 Tax=Streptomyces griseorubiginosus TaxID=67304 RepID=UPI003680B720